MSKLNELNLFSKIILYICLLSGIVWLGSNVTRLTLTYQLFVGNNFALKSYLNNQNLPGIFITLNAAAILTTIVYAIFIFSFLLFLISSRLNLKENGWLLIVTIIIAVTFPFELYLILNDYRIFVLIQSGSLNINEILNFTIKRFKILGSFPIIEILCYFSIIYLILFKPLRSIKKNNL